MYSLKIKIFLVSIVLMFFNFAKTTIAENVEPKSKIENEEKDRVIEISSIDHVVLTVKSVDSSIAFYKALGMKEITFQNNRKALVFGTQKINLHEFGNEFVPRAQKPTPGSADLCFIVKTPINKVIEKLKTKGIKIIEGPVERTGAISRLKSIYIRDPDQNLIELSNPIL